MKTPILIGEYFWYALNFIIICTGSQAYSTSIIRNFLPPSFQCIKVCWKLQQASLSQHRQLYVFFPTLLCYRWAHVYVILLIKYINIIAACAGIWKWAQQQGRSQVQGLTWGAWPDWFRAKEKGLGKLGISWTSAVPVSFCETLPRYISSLRSRYSCRQRAQQARASSWSKR
jgi:hypothetical protein